MIIQKTKIKKLFNDEGVQVNQETLDLINREILFKVKNMALRCKNGNIKRLPPNLFGYALGNYNT